MSPTKNQSSLLISLSLCLFLLFFLLPDSISSIPSPSCHGRNRSKDTISLHFSFYDEFGDEASALHDGGGLNLSCRHRNKHSALENCQKWFLHFYYNNSKLATRIITQLFFDFNQYSNQKEKKEMDEVYNGKYSLGCSCCSVEEEGVGRLHIEGKICHPLKGKVCSTDGVCLEKNGEKTCERNSLLQENGAQFTSETGYKLCFGSKIRGNTWAPEYKQFGRNLLWPNAETYEKSLCTDPRFYKIREGKGHFRKFVALRGANFSYTLRVGPKGTICKIGKAVECFMKLLTGDSMDVQEKLVKGNCTDGWAVLLDEIWNVSRAKIVCSTLSSSGIDKENNFYGRWQFVVLPFVAKVRERKDGKGKECVWPGWLKKEPSDLVGDECRDESGKPVQLTVNYPPPQAGAVLTFKTLFPEEATTPSPSTEAPTDRPSRVPRWLRVLPIVFLGVGVVQALPFLLYYGYWECVSWLHRRKRRREEETQKEKEQQEKKATLIRASRIDRIRDHRRFNFFKK